MPDDSMKTVAIQWLRSRDIIAKFLDEMYYGHHGFAPEFNEENAAAIIARLAGADPPLLICTPDEIND